MGLNNQQIYTELIKNSFFDYISSNSSQYFLMPYLSNFVISSQFRPVLKFL